MVAFSCLGPFPEDILREEILLKLPAKPLLRFKSVSKGWRSIISSPSFVTRHFNRDTDLNRGLVIYCSGYNNETGNMCDSFSYFPDTDATFERHEVPNQLLLWGEITFFRGPCNGIVCIHSANNRFALWNPTTRRLRPIYCSPSFKFDEIGFGVDPLTGDFKIVLIQCYDSVSSSFAVYTSRSHSWKYLEQESLCDSEGFVSTQKSYSNTFLNGYYYWLKCTGSDRCCSILGFDMHNEIFEEINAPDVEPWQLPGKLHLLNDSLSYVTTFQGSDGTYVDIWLMEGKGQWTFLLSLFVPVAVFVISGVHGFWGGKKILLEVYFKDSVFELILCDFTCLDAIFLKGLKIKHFLSDPRNNLIPMHHKESLFTVKGEDGMEEYDTRSPEGLELLGYQGPFMKICCSKFRREANGYPQVPRDCAADEVQIPCDIGDQYLVAESEKVDSDDPVNRFRSYEC